MYTALFMALRALDGTALELHLRSLDRPALHQLLDSLAFLDAVFNPVAATTIQRYARGRLMRHHASQRPDGRGASRVALTTSPIPSGHAAAAQS